MRESKFKYVTIFVDGILHYNKEIYPEAQYSQFIKELLLVIHHEYVHHFIPIEYVGHEKTKVDPMANALVNYLIQDWDEWCSWWALFYDCLEWLRCRHSETSGLTNNSSMEEK